MILVNLRVLRSGHLIMQLIQIRKATRYTEPRRVLRWQRRMMQLSFLLVQPMSRSKRMSITRTSLSDWLTRPVRKVYTPPSLNTILKLTRSIKLRLSISRISTPWPYRMRPKKEKHNELQDQLSMLRKMLTRT